MDWATKHLGPNPKLQSADAPSTDNVEINVNAQINRAILSADATHTDCGRMMEPIWM